MPNFLIQVAYSREGWQALVRNPQDRIEAVRPAIEKLGGRVEHAWFAFGDYDLLLVADMPNNVNAAAIAIAFAGGGACKNVHTTPLLSMAEAVEAMKPPNRGTNQQQSLLWHELRGDGLVAGLRRPSQAACRSGEAPLG